MPRRRKNSPVEALISLSFLVIFVGSFSIIFFTNWLRNGFGLPTDLTCNLAVFSILALTFGTPIAIFVIYNTWVDKKYKGLKIANIDLMTGIEFELYLQRLLKSQGYKVQTTQVSGDLGVDLVASRNNEKIAIQAKRYESKVSRQAISDAVAGMYHYGCNRAMVITNSYFSPGAITLARSTGCILIDRDTLANWVTEFQKPS